MAICILCPVLDILLHSSDLLCPSPAEVSKMLSSPTLTDDLKGVDVKPPPLGCLQSRHGGDAVSPMWPLLLVCPQNILFLPQEYFGSSQTNDRCQSYI